MRRRDWLAGAAGLVVVFSTGCSLPVIPRRPRPDPEAALSWLRHVDGRYTLWLPRMEMGQGIAPAMRRIAAEFLGVDASVVEVRLPRTQDVAPFAATVGSASVREFARPLAEACVALRRGLAEGRSGRIDLLPQAAAQPWPAFRAPAQAMADAAALVRGDPLFAGDISRPGMLHGRVVRGPTSPELRSTLAAADEQAARRVPGVVAVVQDPLLTLGASEGVGLLARTPGALDAAEAALQARWSAPDSDLAAGDGAALDVDARLSRGALRHRLASDPVEGGAWDVDLRLDVPAAAHGMLQPRVAVAQVHADGVRLWAGSQDPFYVRDVVARRLGVERAAVDVQAMRMGGAFGARTLCTVELEAAVLSRAAGVPVKVQWTRAQELQQGFHRPPSSHRIRARLAGGRLQAWWHAFASSHILFTNAVLPRWLQQLTDFAGDDGVARGAIPPYRCGRRRIEFDLVRLPLLTGPWRGLGAGPNGMAVECAIDDCARATGRDPVAFRLDHIEDPRLANVLRRVAQAAGTLSASVAADGSRRARGVACGIYKGNAYAAVAAEVAVAPDGAVRVTQLWCSHDCGRIADPDRVAAQCEGNLAWGVGMVLHDSLPFQNGGVAASTFAQAPVPRWSDIPPMRVDLVDGADAPGGAGETAIVAAAAAILNAMREATGRRIRRLPVAAADLR